MIVLHDGQQNQQQQRCNERQHAKNYEPHWVVFIHISFANFHVQRLVVENIFVYCLHVLPIGFVLALLIFANDIKQLGKTSLEVLIKCEVTFIILLIELRKYLIVRISGVVNN